MVQVFGVKFRVVLGGLSVRAPNLDSDDTGRVPVWSPLCADAQSH